MGNKGSTSAKDIENGIKVAKVVSEVNNEVDKLTTSMAEAGPPGTSVCCSLKWEATLCYAFPLIAVFIAFFEKKNTYGRFHGWQAMLLFIVFVPPMVIAEMVDMFAKKLFFGGFELIVWAIYIVFCGVCAFLAWRRAETQEAVRLPYLGNKAMHLMENGCCNGNSQGEYKPVNTDDPIEKNA